VPIIDHQIYRWRSSHFYHFRKGLAVPRVAACLPTSFIILSGCLAMSKLLVVETSPRGDHSISRQMTRRFVEDWRAAHPSGEIVERDLAETDLQFVTPEWL
jgi:hypothetical protein